MELRQLIYFVAVAEELSFTRAATRLRIAQPAVSQQVRRLERELRQELFDRSDRRIRLTTAGEIFLAHARTSLTAAQAGRNAMHSLGGELSGVLTVGTIPAPPRWLLERLRSFRARHPKVRFKITTGDPERLAELVSAAGLDLALVGVTGPRQPAGSSGRRLGVTLGSRPIDEEPLVVVTPPGHPLARREQVTLKKLGEAQLVTLSAGSGLRAVLESAFAAAGLDPDIAVEANAVHDLGALVAAGLGVAVLPTSVAAQLPEPLPALRLIRPSLVRSTHLVWHRKSSSLLARAFLSENKISDAGEEAHTDPDAADPELIS